MEPVEKAQGEQTQPISSSQTHPQQLAQLPSTEHICPQCKKSIEATDVYCPHCGKQLLINRPGIGKQIGIYLFSLVAAPLGLWWAWKYLRQPDQQTKTVGVIIIGITVFAVVVELWYGMQVYNALNSSIATDLKMYEGTGY